MIAMSVQTLTSMASIARRILSTRSLWNSHRGSDNDIGGQRVADTCFLTPECVDHRMARNGSSFLCCLQIMYQRLARGRGRNFNEIPRKSQPSKFARTSPPKRWQLQPSSTWLCRRDTSSVYSVLRPKTEWCGQCGSQGSFRFLGKDVPQAQGSILTDYRARTRLPWSCLQLFCRCHRIHPTQLDRSRQHEKDVKSSRVTSDASHSLRRVDG